MKNTHIPQLFTALLLANFITPLANAAAVLQEDQLGGATSFAYTYDDLYRLTGATGVWNSAPNTSESFTLAMDYDSIHNIVGKDQDHIRTVPGGVAVPQAKTSYDWLYTYASAQPHAASLIGDRAYSYDANGNQTGWDHVSNGTRRTITWDEENRIQAIADNGHTLTYVYDDAGERVIKSGPQGETAYVNQFFVVRNREVATKHIFAGGTRLVSKMATQPDATSPTAGNSDQAPWGWLHSNAGGNSPNSGGTVFEKDQYYFHPDHLGSSSYVTDIDGEIFQHLEYFPFGETFVEESSNTQRTPYLFTGKELDEETGLYYFGSRYYDPRTSVWQSADPILASYMAGKGSGGGVFVPPNLNLFGYVQQRPLVAVDPNGEDVVLTGSSTDRQQFLAIASKMTGVPLSENNGKIVAGSTNGSTLRVSGNAMINAINSPDSITMDVVNAVPRVMMDSFVTNQVDVADLEGAYNNNAQFGESVLTHIIVEKGYAAANANSAVGANDPAAFGPAHAAAEAAEVSVMGASSVIKAGNPSGGLTIQYLDSSGNVNNTINLTLDANKTPQ